MANCCFIHIFSGNPPLEAFATSTLLTSFDNRSSRACPPMKSEFSTSLASFNDLVGLRDFLFLLIGTKQGNASTQGRTY
uniref:Uncharacterized protein n=1 Tax=Arundo donax TaxID=35708 RepID=A0A0A9G1L5_ARUDO